MSERITALKWLGTRCEDMLILTPEADSRQFEVREDLHQYQYSIASEL
jgi:hypothetical protein